MLRHRVRVFADRFELAFWDPILWIAALALACYPWPLLVELGCRSLLATAALAIVLGLSCRVTLVVTREGSWVASSVLGIRWSEKPLGRHPTLENNGWSWGEIAVLPSQPELRAGLHDDERAVLAEWNLDDVKKNRDAEQLMVLARAQIQRLHESRW